MAAIAAVGESTLQRNPGQLGDLVELRGKVWLSVGHATALVCTVVSTVIRGNCRSFNALVYTAIAIVSANRNFISPAPIRLRQCIIDDRSEGSRCQKCVSPQTAWKYGFSPRPQKAPRRWAPSCA